MQIFLNYFSIQPLNEARKVNIAHTHVNRARARINYKPCIFGNIEYCQLHKAERATTLEIQQIKSLLHQKRSKDKGRNILKLWVVSQPNGSITNDHSQSWQPSYQRDRKQHLQHQQHQHRKQQHRQVYYLH